MPYTEYPIRYTNSKLGYKDKNLYAQTLENSTFFGLSDRSYGYFTSENKSVLNPTATDSPVPLAPWFPFNNYDEEYWGLDAASINNSLAHLKPGLNISTYSSSKASDIALAGTRPVDTENLTVTVPPLYFYPNGLEYVENPTLYSAIDIVIYVSREEGSTSPKLIVERQYFNVGSASSTPDKTVEIHNVDIPDVPYFVFNFAVCAPGAPSTDTQYKFFDPDGNILCLNPGGGSGAGALFTAVLSTNPVNLTEPAQSHTDKITIHYTLAKQSYSSSLAGFDPSSISNESDNGIDVVKITADLHYTVVSTDSKLHYPYSRKCTLPGGLIYPGLEASYSDNAKDIINDFDNSKDTPELVNSTFPTDSLTASMASALIIHKANWMLPEDVSFLTNTNPNLPRYQLYQPFTLFNPEALFPSPSVTRVGESPYIGAAGRPSILHDGASTVSLNQSPPVFETHSGDSGAGASGSIWYDSDDTPYFLVSSGGVCTIILSW